MKNKKNNLCYKDIFGEVSTSIKVRKGTKNNELDPFYIRQVILSLFGLKPIPTFLLIEHSSLIERLFIIFFQGLDEKRYNENENLLTNFLKLKENGFPITILTKNKELKLISPEQSLLG